MENEAGSLHAAAVRAIVEGINQAQSLRQEYPITLRCSQCGEEATRVNAATQDAVVKTEEDVSIPGHPLDVTVIRSRQALNLMVDARDRKTPMDENFLHELGLEIFIKRIDRPESLEELGRTFRADRGINTEETCADCEKRGEFKTNASEK